MSEPLSGWSTSFFYKQDLRSYYMNNLLNEGFKPGIYNPDMYVYADEEGLKLFIKKGTTFIFSNGVSLSGDSSSAAVYERNLDNPVKNGDFLIKCFPTTDSKITLLKKTEDCASLYLGDGSSLSASSKIYIFAKIEYDKDDELGVNKGAGPTFFLGLRDEEKSSFLSFKNFSQGNSLTSIDTVPENLKTTCYLILGTIQNSSNSLSSYIVSHDWKTEGYKKWNRQHFFTGRNVPDYRYNLIASRNIKSPEILAGTGEGELKRLYVDLPCTSINGDVLEQEVNWKELEKENNYLDLNEIDSSILSYNTDNFLAIDFIYLPIDNKSSKISTIENGCFLPSEAFSKPDKLELRSYRSFVKESTLGDLNIKPSEVFALSKKKKEWWNRLSGISKDESEMNLIPLDIGKSNQDRLRSFIENRSLLLAYIINNMRHDSASDLGLNPEYLNSLIPVAFIFRYLNSNLKSADEEDEISNEKEFNPTNLLSFFDLQFKSTQANIISLNCEDVFSTLPTL